MKNKFELPITANMFPFTGKKGKNKKYITAAKKVAKDTLKHFSTDGWDLNFNTLLDEVFYEVNKENLEIYLLEQLKDSGLVIKMGKGVRGVVVGKKDNNKAKPTKKK